MTDRIILAASVALRHGDRFLLVERGRAPARGQFAFPGGRLEQDESPEEAARRELIEETGLATGELALFQIMDLGGDEDSGGVLFRLHVFTGAYVEGDAAAHDDAASVGWYSVEEMKALPINTSTLEVARRILGL
ncbi:MAG: NUDIX domain-containing protein [Hyphomicrobiales bacterium]|nr:NUDIX domain-containing protein [Hyphomicrobiales bacterium]